MYRWYLLPAASESRLFWVGQPFATLQISSLAMQVQVPLLPVNKTCYIHERSCCEGRTSNNQIELLNR